jgi:hypothetical protein
MKRKITVLLVLLILTALIFSLITGCGAKSATDSAVSDASSTNAVRGISAPSYDYDSAEDKGTFGGTGYGYEGAEAAMQKPAPTEARTASNESTSASNLPAAIAGDKIIYSGSAEVESLEFDASVDHVYKMIARYDGFLESSYVSGSDYRTEYYGWDSYRTAQFVIRIPKEHFKEMTDGLSELGNVTSTSTQAQNITSQYTDTESQLKAYRTEEERLLKILEKAETVADMITIEDRLSQVRYNIENLTTQLNGWDSRINYSTLELYIKEVSELSEEPVIKKTFWQEIVGGVKGSVQRLIRFCKDCVIFILSAVPVLVIPAAIVIVVLLIIRSRRRKKTAEAKKSSENKME